MTPDATVTPFIATDLTTLDWPIMPTQLQDLEADGLTFRPLSPDYYAWLRHRMTIAKDHMERGKMPSATFDALRIRFNAIHDQAVGLFGESSLLDAVQLLDPESYPWPGRPREEPEETTHAEIPKEDEHSTPRCSPDTPGIPEGHDALDGMSRHAFPGKDPERFQFNQPVSKYALAQVDAIREEALGKGWTEAQLYQTRGRYAFPCGGDYGLVCLIHDDQRLGKVSRQRIQIICGRGHSLHFYRKEEST